MIDSAIFSIVEELNDSLNVKFRLNENRVIASNLINLDGSLSIKDENRIVDFDMQYDIKPMDIVFMSYDEPNADQNWEKLKTKYPRAKRVHGVSPRTFA
mgnify:CR=1 FL=1